MMGIGMAVRPPRARGPVLMMIAALRRLGGSLWMVDNAFTGAFVDNVGTTPVTAVADLIGKVLDKTGTNHATQSAVASKPSVQRVPKRLGPNLVSNGTFDSGTTGWTNSSTGTGTFTVSAGVATITGTDGANRGALAQQLTGLNVGATYTVTFTATGSTSSFNIQTSATPGAGVVSAVLTTAGRMTVVATATSLWVVAHTAAGGGTTTIDNIVVQEVLEWANVISFDGSNDFLQTGITTGNEGWVCAGVTFSGAASGVETVFSTGAGNAEEKGVWLARVGSLTENSWRVQVSNGAAASSPVVSAIALRNTPRVVDGGWTATTVVAAVDGQEASAARTGDAASAQPARIGQYTGGTLPLNGPMTAIAYTPVLPDAADRKIIRDGIAALQGRTL